MNEIRKLPASAGAQWLLDAFALYRRAPLQLAVLGVIGMLASSLIMVVAQALPSWLGSAVWLLGAAVGPVLFGGMLWAMSEIEQGHRAQPVHLLQPIRDRRVTHLLVPLAIQVVAFVGLFAVLMLLIGEEGMNAAGQAMIKTQELQQAGTPSNSEAILALWDPVPVKRILLWIALVFAVFVSLSMALFTQPALVVFDRHSGMHALRMSLQGCIENFGAMVVFMLLGLITLFCISVIMVILSQLALLLGGPAAGGFVVQLIYIAVIMPLYVGAVYAAWKQMFAHRGRTTPPPVPPTTRGPGNVFEA